MSLNRYAKKKDENHRVLITALRLLGCSVEVVTCETAGGFEGWVGCFGIDQPFEVKPNSPLKKHQLSDEQREFHAKWRGRQPVVLRTVEDCEALVASLRGALTQSEVAR